MKSIKLTDKELQYLWGFLMAHVANDPLRIARDKHIVNVLAKIKKQFPFLMTVRELKEVNNDRSSKTR